jgi:hypothetical protein
MDELKLMDAEEATEEAQHTTYTMVCSHGEYCSYSWIGLGWAILTHRLQHLWNDHKWMD